MQPEDKIGLTAVFLLLALAAGATHEYGLKAAQKDCDEATTRDARAAACNNVIRLTGN